MPFHDPVPRPLLRRSVLSVPAINPRALAKAPALACDAVIFDLEDSVAPQMKEEARANLRALFKDRGPGDQEWIIRVNAADSAFFADDMQAVIDCGPDAVLLPKVGASEELQAAADALSGAGLSDLPLMAMMETTHGVLNAPAIARWGVAGKRLSAFVIGLNDLRRETGVLPDPQRTYLIPWLMQIVLVARAYGIDVIDSVSNDFRDLDAFGKECGQGRAMGFDGKMLIHPAQIAAANAHFSPSAAEIADAEATVAAFADPSAAGLNVVTVNGRMVERLHLEQAERLIARADLIQARKSKTE
ncbi:HpcH/HpaI aldolase/citrate lyase family protein [Rhizobium halophytocola]|uniref:Citrate lyase subunit beta/citryl-CoA lyase n=2 Tax=Rhizobium halophytocola TaxID=735519 RepID=A0ABS4E204_9HYPH|nr:citrate lyase subunit beta/citryl-CoA lyase [Rhizobium halophytocola]